MLYLNCGRFMNSKFSAFLQYIYNKYSHNELKEGPRFKISFTAPSQKGNFERKKYTSQMSFKIGYLCNKFNFRSSESRHK